MVGDRKELFCRRCEAEYTHMEVLDNIDPLGRGSGFLCKRCDNLLDIRDPEEDAAKEVNDRPAFFNKQFECIINLLHKIDAHTIPATDPEALLNDARVMLNNAYLTTSANERLKARSQLNAVRGIQTGPEKIEISITNPADGQSAEDVAEMERRVRIAEQNRLPEWHTKSTIFNNGPAPSQSAQAAQSLDVKPVVDVKNTATEETEKDGLDSYFATLQAEQDIWEAVKDEGFDDDDDDENEDEEGES